MTTFTIPGDDYDPCAKYIELRKVHAEVLEGGTIKRIRFRNGEEERETDFSPANLKDLERAMAQAKRECIEKTTGRPARHAIGIGIPGPAIRRIY